jgi:ABC-type bacteriocin/lantibiotic exporter with double-glycine peptidase domain
MPLTLLHVQTQSTECGLAAMGMILGHHGRHVSMEILRAVSGVSRDCVNGADLIRVADHFGLKARVLRREPDQLPDLGFPLVVYLDLSLIHILTLPTIVSGCRSRWSPYH